MKKKYKFGDKVIHNDEKGLIIRIKKVKNDSGDKYDDYLYRVLFEDRVYLDLSYEDFEVGWKSR